MSEKVNQDAIVEPQSVPVGPVDPFSQLPDSGIQSEADLLKLSGIKTLEGTIPPGPDSNRYAFTKQSVHRNIYRVHALTN